MAISNEGPQTSRRGIGKRWPTRQELLDPQDRSGRRARSVVKRSCSQQEFPAVDISRGSDRLIRRRNRRIGGQQTNTFRVAKLTGQICLTWVWLLWNDAPAGGMKTAAILGGGISKANTLERRPSRWDKDVVDPVRCGIANSGQSLLRGRWL